MNFAPHCLPSSLPQVMQQSHVSKTLPHLHSVSEGSVHSYVPHSAHLKPVAVASRADSSSSSGSVSGERDMLPGDGVSGGVGSGAGGRPIRWTTDTRLTG